MLNNKIKTFRRSLTIGNIVGLFFVSLVGALPIFLASFQHMKNIMSSINILFIFTVFFYTLFLLLFYIDLKGSKRIIVFSDGISSFNRKLRKRTEMTFKEMANVKIVDFTFGDKYIVVKSKSSDDELLIPYPIKKYDDFINTLSEVAGKNHILVLEKIT